MLKVAIALFFIFAQVLSMPQPETVPHVVGGTPAPVGSYPFAVSLRNKGNGDFFCGGSLVSERFVMTAAHCVFNPNVVLVGMGSVDMNKQQTFEVDKGFPHPGYRPPSTANDIGLYRLKKPVNLTSSVQLIEFPYTKSVDDRNVTAMGWGRTSANGPASNRLLFLKKKALSNNECQKRLKPNGSKILPCQVCLGSTPNQGMCFGDSGSPLLLQENNRNYAVGVVSWGVPCAMGFPDVFSRVSYYSDWLQETMAKNL